MLESSMIAELASLGGGPKAPIILLAPTKGWIGGSPYRFTRVLFASKQWHSRRATCKAIGGTESRVPTFRVPTFGVPSRPQGFVDIRRSLEYGPFRNLRSQLLTLRAFRLPHPVLGDRPRWYTGGVEALRYWSLVAGLWSKGSLEGPLGSFGGP